MPEQGFSLDTTWRTLLKDLGVSPANVLRRANLADDLLTRSSVRLTSEEYYRLWNGIEAETGDPAFPITLCKIIRSESFSPPLFAALCSPSLFVAAQRIARYKPLIAPFHFSVTQQNEFVILDFRWPSDALSPPISLVLMELLFCVTIARMGTREHVRPIQVMTTRLPSDLPPYEEYFGVRLESGQTNSIAFSQADGMRPFLTSSESMWSAFEPELRERLSQLEASATTSKRVRAALLEALPSGMVTMEDIARKLAVSKRTLQRRIESEGSTFQQILRETRGNLATHYLEKTNLPASEIAFLLGFEELNSFYRAFRSWTGMTPETARHMQFA